MKVDVDTEIELKKCPHILIGGCTGSGKTYLMRHMLNDVLNDSEGQMNIVVIDPKNVDYQYLRDDPRWLGRGIEIVDRDGIDSGYCNQVLGWLCYEMEQRYKLMKKLKVYDWSDIDKMYDKTIDDRLGIGETFYGDDYGRTEMKGAEGTGEGPEGDRAQCGSGRILLVVDELTDLIYYDRDKERGFMRGQIERSLVRLAMLGRAAGVHIMLGTQRPDAQTLPGQLRANIGCRICLRVSTEMERRIVLGQSGKGYGERCMEYQSNMYSLKYQLD